MENRQGYSGQNDYTLAGSGWASNGATHGGAARVHWTGSSFTVNPGFVYFYVC